MNIVEFLLTFAAVVGVGGFGFASGYMYGVRWALNKYAEIEQAKLKAKNFATTKNLEEKNT
jgi:hypothetical protein